MMTSDIVVACVITGLAALFCGFKMGQWVTMSCINNICDELRKQLDIDGKPFERLSHDDDDDADDWLENEDWWKNK